MDIQQAVAENIHRIRKAQKLSIDRAAELSGVSKSMWGQIERGLAGQRLCGGKVIPYRLFPFDPESRSEPLQLDLFISGRYEGPDRIPGSWVYVTSLSGTAEVTTGGETYRLENRDCLSFPGSQPYCYENVGNNTVRLIQRIVYKK